MRPLIEAVPNFSEGRDATTLAALRAAIAETKGVALLDDSSDSDHHRSVYTLAGPPAAAVESLMRAARVAVERIDLRRHHGAHPRIGALDVAPFIPLQEADWSACIEAARSLAEKLWEDLNVPSYFYGKAALRPQRRQLERVRRGGFEALREAVRVDADRRPDTGGPALHPTAGATAIGVREFLIAFNVNLRTKDPASARRIARLIRESSGGYPCVKALGLELPDQRLTQVSMNLTDFRTTGLATVVERIRREAAADGVECAGGELVGLIPQAALDGTNPGELLLEDFSPDSILENRLVAAGAAGKID